MTNDHDTCSLQTTTKLNTDGQQDVGQVGMLLPGVLGTLLNGQTHGQKFTLDEKRILTPADLKNLDSFPR